MQSMFGIVLMFICLGTVCGILGDVLKRPLLGICLLAIVNVGAALVTFHHLARHEDIWWCAAFLGLSTFGASLGFLGASFAIIKWSDA